MLCFSLSVFLHGTKPFSHAYKACVVVVSRKVGQTSSWSSVLCLKTSCALQPPDMDKKYKFHVVVGLLPDLVVCCLPSPSSFSQTEQKLYQTLLSRADVVPAVTVVRPCTRVSLFSSVSSTLLSTVRVLAHLFSDAKILRCSDFLTEI